MTNHLNPPLTPRNGHTLEVICPSRVSDLSPGKQDTRSLDDQLTIQKRWLDQHTQLPRNLTIIAGSGSGELLDRKEYLDLVEKVESCKYDLVVVEDLGRIARRTILMMFCERCEDTATRLIAIRNCGVDTAAAGWREAAFFTSFFYEKENRDRSDRLKERLRARFIAGAALPITTFGYVKPQDCKHENDLRKDPEAEAILREWFERLDRGERFADISDWLISTSVPLPPNARQHEWSSKMVARITYNPLLKGVRERNRRKSKRINESGRYVSVKAAPEELLQHEVPHLAFFEADYYDRITNKLRQRNKHLGRPEGSGRDPRLGRPKKRTRFPGQTTYCGICDHLYVFGGHGQNDHLVCSGARNHRCWNGITVDGPVAAHKISGAVFKVIEQLPDFDAEFRAQVDEAAQRLDTSRNKQLQDLTRAIAKLEREQQNLLRFIRDGSNSASIRQDVERIEKELAIKRLEYDTMRATPTGAVTLPAIEELKQLGQMAFADLARDSFEFADRMRELIPRIVVFPYRMIDGGRVVLRARFKLNPAGGLPDVKLRHLLAETMTQIVEVNLFDPPQREAFRTQVVQARQSKTERHVAEALGITITAVQRATTLHRKIQSLGLNDPYVPMIEPSDDAPRLRRHRHPRYRFDPLPEAGKL